MPLSRTTGVCHAYTEPMPENPFIHRDEATPWLTLTPNITHRGVGEALGLQENDVYNFSGKGNVVICTGCQVFKQGVRNSKDFCPRINIPWGYYFILRIVVVTSCQKAAKIWLSESITIQIFLLLSLKNTNLGALFYFWRFLMKSIFTLPGLVWSFGLNMLLLTTIQYIIALPLDSLLLRGVAARPCFCLRARRRNTRGVMRAHMMA